MKLGRNLGIKGKIYIGFLVILLLMSMVASTGVYNIIHVNQQINEIKTKQSTLITYENLTFDMLRTNAAIRGYLVFGKPRMVDNYKQLSSDVQNRINKLKELGEQPKQLLDFEQGFSEWNNSIDK